MFGSGLFSGVKPCTYTTLIVLISFLIVTGRSRKGIFVAGLTFVIAMFLTYIISGLSFFKFDLSLTENSIAGMDNLVYEKSVKGHVPLLWISY